MKRPDDYEIEWFDCDCGDIQHAIRFTFDHDPDFFDGELTIEAAFPAYGPWYKRLWIAAKYVLKKDKSGTYGCWLLARNDVDRLQGLIDKYRGVLNAPKQKDGLCDLSG